MPRINPCAVITFSSEDPNHPASNLLLSDTFRKWKCRSEGESIAFIVLKFDKAETITAIDIGNENSAFVEIHVGRTGSEPLVETLLSSSAFMSPIESRSGTSPNRVRMFSLDKLNKSVAAQKWDTVKIICTQQFNKHVKFGLSFITFHSKTVTIEEPKVGGFSILPHAESDFLKAGSLFGRKKKLSETVTSTSHFRTSTAVSIREASAVLITSSTCNNGNEKSEGTQGKRKLDGDVEMQESVGKYPKLQKEVHTTTSIESQSRDRGSSGSPVTPYRPIDATKRVDSPKTISVKQRRYKSNPRSSSEEEEVKTKVKDEKSTLPRKVQPPNQKIRKPFNKLFDGIVFSISGYENPYRSSMRNKAIEMGAICKQNWDDSCTHLICAFVNTPKFREVRSSRHGKIAKMKWIEDSYAQKKRLPWRKYWVDRNDKMEESEEEIETLNEDEVIVQNIPSQSDTDEIESKEPGSKDESETEEKELAKKSRPGINKYVISSSEDDADTDEYDKVTIKDLSPEYKSTKDYPMKSRSQSPAPDDFFRNISFYLDPELEESAKSELGKIIKKHEGTVRLEFDGTVEYFVTEIDEWKSEFSGLLCDNPSLSVIRAKWIRNCGEGNTMTSAHDFILVPV